MVRFDSVGIMRMLKMVELMIVLMFMLKTFVVVVMVMLVNLGKFDLRVMMMEFWMIVGRL